MVHSLRSFPINSFISIGCRSYMTIIKELSGNERNIMFDREKNDKNWGFV